EIADKLDKRRRQKFIRLHLSDKNRRRMRRQQPNENGQKINWLSVLKPIVLEPYMFTPIYGLSVLGPLILSPNIFSPLILAPSVLGPWILSPAAPVPFILSPYVF
uniref:Sine oculis binding protein homolog n=1 Tax=Globodera pallida TaxID=36090 RepID=A0A183CT21_GLOPA